jgi:hypothetical protein
VHSSCFLLLEVGINGAVVVVGVLVNGVNCLLVFIVSIENLFLGGTVGDVAEVLA